MSVLNLSLIYYESKKGFRLIGGCFSTGALVKASSGDVVWPNEHSIRPINVNKVKQIKIGDKIT